MGLEATLSGRTLRVIPRAVQTLLLSGKCHRKSAGRHSRRQRPPAVNHGNRDRENGHSLSYLLETIPNPMEPTMERRTRSEEHTSELQSRGHLVYRLLLEKKKPELGRKQK